MKYVQILLNDITSLKSSPTNIRNNEDLLDYVAGKGELRDGDLIILRNQFYQYKGSWKKVSNQEAEMIQTKAFKS